MSVTKSYFQGSLFPDMELEDTKGWRITNFSADNVNPQEARLALEERYWPITEVTERFNRQSVSYQMSKKDCLHRWLKYKEGFSAELVRILLDDFNLKEGDVVVDPFMGSGTTALVSILNGFNSYGFDVLPMSKVSIQAKNDVYEYDVNELKRLLKEVEELWVPEDYDKRTSEISITRYGYPEKTSRDLAFYKEYFDASDYSGRAKTLLQLCTLNSLERISYSAKDGQYLRWDYRCKKIVDATEARKAEGRKPFVVILDKGDLPTLKDSLTEELEHVIDDIMLLQQNHGETQNAVCNFIEGSSLFELPKMKSNEVSAVISSPPYCNRYDYTRTYAMELAYLGLSDEKVLQLRQDLLSCTVENKPKIEKLREHYQSLNRESDFDCIYGIVKNNDVLNEINAALARRNELGEINNKGILKMVDGYFTELAFVFAELYRVCKKGAHVAFVNDNVRYAGEVIPVDYLTSYLAEQIGFTPQKIYTLRQQKGNSSQQMKKYGRVALRKSITIWQK